MSKEKITVRKTAYAKVLDAVTDAYPLEGCGVLLGEIGYPYVSDVRIIQNPEDYPDAKTNFHIGPEAIYEIEKEADENGLEILGFFHSHPDKPAFPSAKDIGYMIPGQINMILSVKRDGHIKSSAYRRNIATEDISELEIRTI